MAARVSYTLLHIPTGTTFQQSPLFLFNKKSLGTAFLKSLPIYTTGYFSPIPQPFFPFPSSAKSKNLMGLQEALAVKHLFETMIDILDPSLKRRLDPKTPGIKIYDRFLHMNRYSVSEFMVIPIKASQTNFKARKTLNGEIYY